MKKTKFMNRLYVYSLLVLMVTAMSLLTSCGLPPKNKAPEEEEVYGMPPDAAPKTATVNGTDPALAKYVQNFENDSYKNTGSEPDTSNLEVQFGETAHRGAKVIGYCQFLNNGQNRIVVNPSWWESATEANKEAMLYHEMGHCVLFRAHKETLKLNSIIPSSMMFPKLIHESVYSDGRQAYLKELFGENYPAMQTPDNRETGETPWNLEERAKLNGVSCDITLDDVKAETSDDTQHRH